MVKHKDAHTLGGFGKAPIALFLMLVIVGASIFAIAWTEAPKAKPTTTIVDANGMLQAFLSSTIDEATYTDTAGRTHVYTGWTVQELLVEDLELRSNSSVKANTTNLEKGLETDFAKMLDDIASDHHYNLKANFGAANFRAKDLNLEGGARSTITIHMRTYDADAKVTLSLTE